MIRQWICWTVNNSGLGRSNLCVSVSLSPNSIIIWYQPNGSYAVLPAWLKVMAACTRELWLSHLATAWLPRDRELAASSPPVNRIVNSTDWVDGVPSIDYSCYCVKNKQHYVTRLGLGAYVYCINSVYTVLTQGKPQLTGRVTVAFPCIAHMNS